MQTFQIMQFLRFVHNVGFCINDVLQTSLIRIFVRPPWLPGDKTGPGIPSVLLKAFLYSYTLNCVVEDKYKIFHDTFQIVCGELGLFYQNGGCAVCSFGGGHIWNVIYQEEGFWIFFSSVSCVCMWNSSGISCSN